MRANAALENCIAVKVQMMRRNRRANIRACLRDKFCGFLGGDMFKHDFKLGEVFRQADHNFVNEDSFAVKNINVLMCDLAVD